jgi:hypothetical protein
VVLLQPVDVFKVDRQQLERATTGVIFSLANPRVKMAATSGWKDTGKSHNRALNNDKYTKLVMDVAKFLDFNLKESYRDKNGQALPEDEGRFHACHAVRDGRPLYRGLPRNPVSR